MKQIQGIAAARGIAFGPIFRFRTVDLHVEQKVIADPDQEILRVEQALVTAREQVQDIYESTKTELAAESAAIFEAHRMMLEDPELLSSIRKIIIERCLNAEFAVQEATESYAQTLESMSSEYFRSRAADIRDIAQRLLRILLSPGDDSAAGLTNPSIIIAEDLTPSDTVSLNKDNVLGFCTAEGSETSHTAILARALGVPAVVGIGQELLSIPDGKELILDGTTGTLLIDPTSEQVEQYRVRRASASTSTEIALSHCHEPAISRDGRRVEVVANIGNVGDAKTALEHGAEGVGLLRTEFLFMERKTLPDEEEQYRAYSTILDAFGTLPVVLRTIDIGGDKRLPYLDLAREMNPFLGVRGLRLALTHPDQLLKPQLRAALRSGKDHHLRIMFPMVATRLEIRQVRKVLEQCRAELASEGKQIANQVQLGIMVEVPSAALMADRLAPEVDFFSIGTNDLTQYTLAADRMNPQLAHLSSAFSPAVLRLIQIVIVQAHKHGKWVGVCGELAGEPLAIPILLGMDLDEFSMNPVMIPTAKQIIRDLRVSECQKLTEAVLGFESADEVRDYIRQKMPELPHE
jgi:phosphoenolpyruvate-protein phosphotransferase